MRSFFKYFFASFLALLIFTLLAVFFLVGFLGGIAAKDKPKIAANSVLILDLGQSYPEQMKENALSIVSSESRDIPGLYDVVRMIGRAKSDKTIAGIYIVANSNPNGFAASEELRNALIDFKGSNKFIIAHGDVISQKAYNIANVADKIYVSPHGFLEWKGFSVEYAFVKGTLEKLDIEPQVFYAGKFKSATEPFRTDQMTPENKLQTSAWINDLYSAFLQNVADARKLDTGTLHTLANEAKIQTAADAVNYKLVDGMRYDDEVKDEVKAKLKIDKYEKINFINVRTYFAATDVIDGNSEKIALIYAEGEIVDGRADERGIIAAENYRDLVRKARLDRSVKAIVLRVNSGGGSAMASETILRELSLAKQEKPVIVSFGDVAASGGYYISCAADSIFAHPVTITGSIGVFGIIPNMQAFFKNKIGVTFDGVKTGPYADAGAIYRPMNENERNMVQAQVNMIYAQFKQRVADGRKKDTAYIDSIGQGRVWTGRRAKEIGLIDRFGGLDDAIKSAAQMAKLSEYSIREYPEPRNIFEQIFGKSDPLNYLGKMREEMGDENFKVYLELKRVREMTNTAQARLPFQFFIN